MPNCPLPPAAYPEEAQDAQEAQEAQDAQEAHEERGGGGSGPLGMSIFMQSIDFYQGRGLRG